MSASFEQLLDENLSTVIMKQGSLVTGIVIDILENHVVVHVGLKSEAAVSISEFNNESGELDIAIGDEVQLTSRGNRRWPWQHQSVERKSYQTRSMEKNRRLHDR